MILTFFVNINFPLFDLTKLEEILIFNLFSIDLLTLLFKKCFFKSFFLLIFLFAIKSMISKPGP